MDAEGMCPDEFHEVDWVGFGTQLLSDPQAPGLLNRGAEVINEFTKTKTKAELLAGALEHNLLLQDPSPPLANYSTWTTQRSATLD